MQINEPVYLHSGPKDGECISVRAGVGAILIPEIVPQGRITTLVIYHRYERRNVPGCNGYAAYDWTPSIQAFDWP